MLRISVLTQTLMEGNVGKLIPLVNEALEAGRPAGADGYAADAGSVSKLSKTLIDKLD